MRNNVDAIFDWFCFGMICFALIFVLKAVEVHDRAVNKPHFSYVQEARLGSQKRGLLSSTTPLFEKTADDALVFINETFKGVLK